jgi:sugar phosphate isomerase/epimerase
VKKKVLIFSAALLPSQTGKNPGTKGPPFHTYLFSRAYCFIMPGISTCCLMTEPLAAALDRLAPLTDLIEVMDEGPHLITDTGLFAGYTQKIILHAPFHGINIASLFEPVRKASVQVTADCFEAAAAIGAPVVVHPGYYAWEQEREAADRQFKKSLRELTRTAREHSLTIWFENMGNMNFFNLRTPESLALIGKTGLALDTGHAHLNGCLEAFLKTPFCHMHIHDNKGKSDTHSAIGEGTIDFKPVLKALERTGASAVLEMKDYPAVIKSIRVLDGM